MQLEAKQAAGPVDIADPYLEEEQWDMEAMVLSTIAGQLEDEEEEEEEAVLDLVEEGDECGGCGECGEDVPFGGWARPAREFRGAEPTAASRRVRMGAQCTHPLPHCTHPLPRGLVSP